MTEVWFRDPYNYVKELVECGQKLVTWNRGVLTKRRIDPVAFMQLYYGVEPVRQILIGEQGSAEVGPGRGLEKPIAVYPTWCGDDGDLDELEEMMAKPVGEDMRACLNASVPPDERPVYGQEHRVVITRIPVFSSGAGKAVVNKLKILQEDYPDCKLLIHGLYGYKAAFGMGFYSADMEPRTTAANGRLMLPGGGESDVKSVQGKPTWLTAMGMTPADIDIPRNRCIYNIKSAVWSGANFDALFNRARTRSSKPVDILTPEESFSPRPGRIIAPKAEVMDTDKVVCNKCSLTMDCMYYREGSVCSVPDAKTGELAKFFGTRDSTRIVDGLSLLMQMGANRLENAIDAEELGGESNKDVTKMINTLFSQGVTLAKLVDPSLRGGGVKVQVGVVNGQATAAITSANNPNELVGGVMRELEARGIPREKITPELVMATLQGMANPETAQRAIESTVISSEEV